MRILILGAGGVGGYLGIRMIQAGLNVRFIVRPDRAAILRRDGLSLQSPLGNWQGYPCVSTADEVGTDADLIILACKAYDLESAMTTVAPAVTDGSIILPFLNGIAHLDRIRSRFPGATVWGGVAHIGVASDGAHKISHLNELNTFLIGSLTGAPTPQLMHDILAMLRQGPTDAQLRQNIQQDLWEKFVFLSTLAGITCLMRADIGTIVATADGGTLIERLLLECSAVAGAEGFPPVPKAMSTYRAQLLESGAKTTSSMLRDIRASRPTEGEHILGDLARRAAVHGIDTPLLNMCLTHVEAYEYTRHAA